MSRVRAASPGLSPDDVDVSIVLDPRAQQAPPKGGSGAHVVSGGLVHVRGVRGGSGGSSARLGSSTSRRTESPYAGILEQWKKNPG
eukprot:460754-Rhodomonas_salina.1